MLGDAQSPAHRRFPAHRLFQLRDCVGCSSSRDASGGGDRVLPAARPRCGPFPAVCRDCTRDRGRSWSPGRAGGSASRCHPPQTGPAGVVLELAAVPRSCLGSFASSSSPASSCVAASCSRAVPAEGVGRPSPEKRPGQQTDRGHDGGGDEDVVEPRPSMLASRIESHASQYGRVNRRAIRRGAPTGRYRSLRAFSMCCLRRDRPPRRLVRGNRSRGVGRVRPGVVRWPLDLDRPVRKLSRRGRWWRPRSEDG